MSKRVVSVESFVKAVELLADRVDEMTVEIEAMDKRIKNFDNDVVERVVSKVAKKKKKSN
jgi:hypothetical protein